MDRTPATKKEADSQLREIRDSRTVSGRELRSSDENISDLHEALNIISDQLYKTTTHFLLELIQNADDNEYHDGIKPALYISLYQESDRRWLRTDCNEVGFNLGQVKALMRVGLSTKKRQNGYIGEKGIGFKSVFKVADVVSIASGFYEFKLDRTQPVGMVRPILARFPPTHRALDHTQFLLHLKSVQNYDQILKDLKDIEPELLIFLRRLQKLSVATPLETRAYQATVKLDDDAFGGETATISAVNERDNHVVWANRYIVHRYCFSGLPYDPRREGITQSEIVLAFPFQGGATPILKRQKAFAFLPIEESGFFFLIQADFLLVASREAIEHNCEWNLALQKGIRKAFVDAMKRLAFLDDGNKKSLCYTWPKYIPSRLTLDPFWEPLRTGILSDLSHSPYFRCRNKTRDFRHPGALRYVPEHFRFENDTLFDIDTLINDSQLLFDYDDVREELAALGVKTQTVHDLLDEFRTWLSSPVGGAAGLGKKSAAWHSKVAAIFCDQNSLRETLKRMQIIPLRDGKWEAANSEHLYLPSENKDEHVPSGVAISIVDTSASRDPRRRHFFEFLGIKTYTPRQVCDLIIELHANGDHVLSNRTDDDLIDDLGYLFRHRKVVSEAAVPARMLVIVKYNGRLSRRRDQIYIVDPSATPGLIRKYRNTLGSPFQVLDDRYEARICNGDGKTTEKFLRWLMKSKSKSFASVPTLVRNNLVTPEWTFLRGVSSTDLLSAVQPAAIDRHQITTLEREVPELEVRCQDGKTRRLSGLALPTSELLTECPHIDFADLPPPAASSWDFLSRFGVINVCDTPARLRELRALSTLASEVVPGMKEAVHRIYRALNSNSDVDYHIKEEFKNRRLIFIPQAAPRWISHDSLGCVWTAPALLQEVIKLRTFYRDCEHLFRFCLGVEPANIDHVVSEIRFLELRKVSPDNIVQRLPELLSLLQTSIEKSGLKPRDKLRLQMTNVFPVAEAADRTTEARIVIRSINNGNWYIPDLPILELAFRGKLNLLYMPGKQIQPLLGLFRKLGAESLLLSEAVQEKVEPHGVCIHDTLREEDIRARMKYISCLAQEENRNVKPPVIWSVPSITITRRVGDVVVVGHDELVMFQQDSHATNIYFKDVISSLEKPKVHLGLARFFSRLFRIDNRDDLNHLNFLLVATLDQLPGFMASLNKFLPDDGEGQAGGETGVHEANADGNGHSGDGHSGAQSRNVEPSTERQNRRRISNSDGGEDKWKNRPEKASSGDDEARGQHHGTLSTPPSSSTRRQKATALVVQSRAENLRPLRELIPTHQSRTKSIIQRAENFQISDTAIARAPAETDFNIVQDGDEQPPAKRLRRSTRNLSSSQPFGGSSARPIGQRSSTGTSSRRHHNGEPNLKRMRNDRSYDSDSPETSGNSFLPGVLSVNGAPESDNQTSIVQLRYRQIGCLGETFIHHLFSSRIDGWTFHNWTSKLRVEDGHPPFSEREKHFADFTYLDHALRMNKLLGEAGVALDPRWTNRTTYHLEVKGTLGDCEETFFVSQNQVDLMRRCHDDPDNAYIILRVFGIESGNVGIKMFPIPWKLYMAGVLDLRSKEGYEVYGGDTTEFVRM